METQRRIRRRELTTREGVVAYSATTAVFLAMGYMANVFDLSASSGMLIGVGLYLTGSEATRYWRKLIAEYREREMQHS